MSSSRRRRSLVSFALDGLCSWKIYLVRGLLPAGMASDPTIEKGGTDEPPTGLYQYDRTANKRVPAIDGVHSSSTTPLPTPSGSRTATKRSAPKAKTSSAESDRPTRSFRTGVTASRDRTAATDLRPATTLRRVRRRRTHPNVSAERSTNRTGSTSYSLQ